MREKNCSAICLQSLSNNNVGQLRFLLLAIYSFELAIVVVRIAITEEPFPNGASRSVIEFIEIGRPSFRILFW